MREYDESKFIQFPHCFYIFAQIFLRPNYVLLPNFVAEFGEDNCYEGKIVQEFQKYLPKFGVDSSAIYCEFFHLEYGQSCNKEKVRNITSVHDDRFSVNVWNSSQVSNEVVSVHKWRDAIQSYTLFRPVSSSENMNRIYKWLESCVLISESVFYQIFLFQSIPSSNINFIIGEYFEIIQNIIPKQAKLWILNWRIFTGFKMYSILVKSADFSQ